MTDIQPQEWALISLDTAADRLGVAPSWLKVRVQSRTIPHHRLGRHIRFSETDLTQIAAAHAAPVIG